MQKLSALPQTNSNAIDTASAVDVDKLTKRKKKKHDGGRVALVLVTLTVTTNIQNR